MTFKVTCKGKLFVLLLLL